MEPVHLGLALLGGAQRHPAGLASAGRHGGQRRAQVLLGARAGGGRIGGEAADAHDEGIGAAVAGGTPFTRFELAVELLQGVVGAWQAGHVVAVVESVTEPAQHGAHIRRFLLQPSRYLTSGKAGGQSFEESLDLAADDCPAARSRRVRIQAVSQVQQPHMDASQISGRLPTRRYGPGDEGAQAGEARLPLLARRRSNVSPSAVSWSRARSAPKSNGWGPRARTTWRRASTVSNTTPSTGSGAAPVAWRSAARWRGRSSTSRRASISCLTWTSRWRSASPTASVASRSA